MATKKIECLNCGTVTEGSFCRNCGQRTDTDRLNPHRLVHDLLERVLLYDGVIRQTLFGLLHWPESVIRRYIAGERQKFVNPVKLFVAAMLFETMVDPFYDWWLRSLFKLNEHGEELYEWRSLQIASLLLTAGIWHLLYFNRRYNFVENVAFCLFVTSEALFVHVFLFLPVISVALPWLPRSVAINIEEAMLAFSVVGFFVYAGHRHYHERGWLVAMKAVFSIVIALTTINLVVSTILTAFRK